MRLQLGLSWLTGEHRVILADTQEPSLIRFVCQQRAVGVVHVQYTRISLHSLDGAVVSAVELPQLPRPHAACKDADANLLYVCPDGERVDVYGCSPAALTMDCTLYPAHLEHQSTYIRHMQVKGRVLVTVDVQGSVRITDRTSSSTAMNPPTVSARKTAVGHELDPKHDSSVIVSTSGPEALHVHSSRLMVVATRECTGSHAAVRTGTPLGGAKDIMLTTQEERQLIVE